jgi:TPR repeat protein
VEQDYKEAVRWCREAAGQGNVQAQAKNAEPDKIFGLWKGVSSKDIDTISLE